MSFLDTVPAAIDQLDYVGPWERFKNSDPRHCLAALREACHADTPLTLGMPDGPSLTASLWAIDEAACQLHFNVNGKTREAAVVASMPLAWAVMYQGGVKLQFPLRDLALSHLQAGRRSLTCATRSLIAQLPTAMYALPRRQTVRVRRAEQGPPELRFAHPFAPEQALQLTVLDISVTGCALRKPAGVLPLLPGTTVRGVEVDLDAETVLFTDMTVQHVTQATADPVGMARVGCRWNAMPASAQDTLAQWIAGGRRRRDLVSISFD